MSITTASRPSKINIPRMVLWLASLVVAVVGYFLMTTSNSKEAALYVSGKADYPKLFAAQSGSTIGGLLIAAGVIGALLALTSMAITRHMASPIAGDARAADFAPADFDEADFDEADAEPAPVVPAAEPAPVAPDAGPAAR
ncbi:hypothetical protein [Frondihabitans cladoniiphilus]|uniref:Uncharacterized protein n=1 Tax=Frondihabitans cladoniiphilus TaxID=715785 RepID=A0ABP8VHW0_9MICO